MKETTNAKSTTVKDFINELRFINKIRKALSRVGFVLALCYLLFSSKSASIAR